MESMGKTFLWIKRSIQVSVGHSSSMLKMRSASKGVSFFLESGCYRPESLPPRRIRELWSVSVKKLGHNRVIVITLVPQERERERAQLSHLKTRVQQASLRRQEHLDALTSHLRQKNRKVSLTKERMAKIVEERFKSFNEKLEEALARRHHHLDVMVDRLRCHTARVAQHQLRIQKRKEELSDKIHEKLEHASLKRQDILNELRNKARPKVNTVNSEVSLLCDLPSNVGQSLQSRCCDVEENHEMQCIPINSDNPSVPPEPAQELGIKNKPERKISVEIDEDFDWTSDDVFYPDSEKGEPSSVKSYDAIL